MHPFQSKMHQIFGWWGLRPDPAVGAHSAFQISMLYVAGTEIKRD